MREDFILIGHPVGHSISPVIHRAAYAALRREGRYELVDAPNEEAVAAQLERLRRGELTGANVTVPWKRVALARAERVDESALRVGAANVLARGSGGEVVAYNTDAAGLAADLEDLLEGGPTAELESSALVLGNGGAALGAVVACQLLGFRRVRVVARSFRGARAAWPRTDELTALGADLVAWPEDPGAPDWAAELGGTRLIVQATSAGMRGADPGQGVAALIPWTRLPPLAAYDLVYNPPDTPFLESARATGHRVRGGLGMLVRQAALALEIWWGVRPPLDPMLGAARAALELPREQR